MTFNEPHFGMCMLTRGHFIIKISPGEGSRRGAKARTRLAAASLFPSAAAHHGLWN